MFKLIWQILIFILVMFTAIYVPLRVAFIDNVSPFILGLELTMDAIFFADIVLTFFSAYETENGYETNKFMIAV